MNRGARFSMAAAAVLLTGCASLSDAPAPRSLSSLPTLGGGGDLDIGAPPPDLSAIELPSPGQEKADEVTKLRREALREAAQAYGSQLGYQRRAWEIEQTLEDRASALSSVYDFRRVIVPAPRDIGVIVPPVVVRAMSSYSLDDDGAAASAANEYLGIVSPARLAPKAPNWRDYLLIGAAEPELPARSLRPDDPEERRLFRAWMQEGWTQGIGLADDAFSEKLARLRRDYEGMLQYRRLVALNMVDEMVISDADFGVVADQGGQVMRIGERAVQIVSKARLNGDAGSWTPVIVVPRDAAMVGRGSADPRAGMRDQRPDVLPESLTENAEAMQRRSRAGAHR